MTISQQVSSGRLKVAVLLSGPPQALELWTLNKVAAVAGELRFILAPREARATARSQSSLRGLNAFAYLSYVVGQALFGEAEQRRRAQMLDRLFDGQHLREWWDGLSSMVVSVSNFGSEATLTFLKSYGPDVLLIPTGESLPPQILSSASLAVLTIDHGGTGLHHQDWRLLHAIAGQRFVSIHSSIADLKQGTNERRLLWQGTPQVSPGDNVDRLLFRAHVEAVDALAKLLEKYASDSTPTPCSGDRSRLEERCASPPSLGAWLKYFYVGRGARSRAIYQRALKCS